MTKSGVIGLSPTVPRTPSVPKYLRDILVGLPDGDDVARLPYVMDTQYCRPAEQREQSHREACRQPLLRAAAGDPAERGLARPADEQRDVHSGERGKVLEQGEVVVEGLAETEAGVDRDALTGDARLFCFLNSHCQETGDFVDHVIIVRRLLHRRRLALLVHETNGAVALRHRL